MTKFYSRWLIVLILVVGTIIGIFKGSEAKQKYVFKIKNRYEEKKQQEELRKMCEESGVCLDEIEMAAFHKM